MCDSSFGKSKRLSALVVGQFEIAVTAGAIAPFILGCLRAG
jgi:hypothetical protein